MGEIADDMVAGLTCSHCGIYFAAEHGYPVLCKDCYRHETRKERAGLPCASQRELGDEDGNEGE